ncbi:MAG: hypothetical protein IKW96_12220 [Ruminococcus sp.]|uniref:DUF6442 family protein n=1 Tax=Ruminococcus sp. TaxID=41978 RepID=UPI0025E3F574|nr:DUF6442 family protein [Ruminococcus sp.]MBR5684020.1 hypothetical protein [Ruminococcus sp.]
MNKEEILAKSRQENKNRDYAEIERLKKSTFFALMCSIGFTCLWTVLSLIATWRVNFAVIATEFFMIFSMHLYKAVKSKKPVDIFCAASACFSFLIFFTIAICELFNIRP